MTYEKERVPPHFLDKKSFEAVKIEIKKYAEMLNEEITDDEIKISKLKNFDAITLEHIIDGQKHEEWIESPLVTEYSVDAKNVKIGSVSRAFGHKVFEYLIKRKWRTERSNTIKKEELKVDHFNGTILTIWMSELKHTYEKKDIEMEMDIAKLEATSSMFIENKNNGIAITSTCIQFDAKYPQTIMDKMPSKKLGEIIKLPHCGNEGIQKALNETSIVSVNQDDEKIEINISKYNLYPIIEEDVKSLWRRYKDIRIKNITAFRINEGVISYDYTDMTKYVLKLIAKAEAEYKKDEEEYYARKMHNAYLAS